MTENVQAWKERYLADLQAAKKAGDELARAYDAEQMEKAKTNPRYGVRFDDGEHYNDLGCSYNKQEIIGLLKTNINQFTNREGFYTDVDEPGSDEANECFFEIILVDERGDFLDDLDIGWTEEQGFDQAMQEFMQEAA